MSGRQGNGNNDGCSGGLALLFLGIFALPLVGLYLVAASKNEEDKALGIVLMVVGIIIWIVLAAIGN